MCNRQEKIRSLQGEIRQLEAKLSTQFPQKETEKLALEEELSKKRQSLWKFQVMNDLAYQVIYGPMNIARFVDNMEEEEFLRLMKLF